MKTTSMDHRAQLARIKRFNQLLAYLRDEMGWPIDSDDFEELTFEYTPEELGIEPKNAAKIQEIRRLRPLTANQPWGIFFVKFEPKHLPVVALRRILGRVVLKKRASANSVERRAWAADDLLFVSNYGEGEDRQITFAHFSTPRDGRDLPTLKVLGWDNRDTALHLDSIAQKLTENLAWPEDETDLNAWRERWRSAFTVSPGEIITTARELSSRLAKLARAIRDRIDAALAIETADGPLTQLMEAFREALVHDLDAKGFADMYAQTIAYGLLSARIADPEKKTADDFAAHMRTNPFLKELMETFLHVGGRRGKAGGPGIDFDELGVSEVIELLDQAKMEAVVNDFGDRNPQEDPVIHFYEGFAKAYDPVDKIRRGEFYTPRPVVSYIVRSVDELLRTEFGLEGGLADTTTWGEMAKRHEDLEVPDGTPPHQAFVQILDPATGTGTFLVEVIDLINKTMVEKWKAQGHDGKKIRALWNEYVPKHLLPRLHAYELKMAPYAIAHLKVGLKLYETGYRFKSGERARVYLTNALEPPGDGQLRLDFLPALAHEAEAVNEIKRKQRFTVVIGNPPYSIRSQNLNEAARAWVDAYREVAGVQIVERNALQFEKNIQDDYIKFIRFSQVGVDTAGNGIVAMVTNHGFLDGATFRGMRWSLLESFSKLWLLDLHGNSNKKETAPDGSKDENVFDISQGVAVSLFVRPPSQASICSVNLNDLWGPRSDSPAGKYRWLAEHSCQTTRWNEASPSEPLFLFKIIGVEIQAEYEAYPGLTDAMPLYSMGIKSSRDELVLDFEPAPVLERIERFRSSQVSDEAICEQLGVPLKKGWNVAKARKDLRALEQLPSHIQRFLYRPFDWRLLFYHRAVVLSAAYSVMQHLLSGKNLALVATRQTKDQWDVQCARALVGHKSLATYDANSVFPLHLYGDAAETQQKIAKDNRVNFSPSFLKLVTNVLGLQHKGANTLPAGLKPEDIFHYAYALFQSPDYRSRYREFLKIDFPRLPLTGNLELFRALARLGGELTALHLLESPKLNVFITIYTGPRNPEAGRVGWSGGTVWLDAGKTNAREDHRAIKPGSIGFQGVPEEVWDFHIGGYQVCHKWLKDRKGRTLSDDDISHYQKIVVALNETIRIMAEIDEVIKAHGGWPGAFQTGSAQAAATEVSATAIPFRPRTVQPKPEDRYVTCVPLVSLKAAAGAFSDPKHVEDDDFEWFEVVSRHRLRKGMFAAQVVGKSMEPAIPDGSYCLFRAPIEGTRQGKTVLVQLRDALDPETGERYTVKRYESDKAPQGDSWHHSRVTLRPANPEFEPVVLTNIQEGSLTVVAELVEVLQGDE